MALSEFLRGVREAANLVFPELWLNPTQEPDANVEWAETLVNIWLAPSLVGEYSRAEFSFLSPEQQSELAEAIAAMKRAIASVGPGNSPPLSQVAEALRAFATVVKIVWPYLQEGPEAEAVRRALTAACRDDRDWILAVDFVLSNDWEGDPSIQVWLTLRDDIDVESPAIREKLTRVRDRIHAQLEKAAVSRWPYVSVRSLSEVRELAGARV